MLWDRAGEKLQRFRLDAQRKRPLTRSDLVPGRPEQPWHALVGEDRVCGWQHQLWLRETKRPLWGIGRAEEREPKGALRDPGYRPLEVLTERREHLGQLSNGLL